MGQVLIRNLDDEIIAGYRAAAVRNARSLEAELREVLRMMRPRTDAEIAVMQERASEIRMMMTLPGPQTSAVDIIREDRDRLHDA